MSKQFEPLESGEVLSVKSSAQFLMSHGTFRISEFAEALKQEMLSCGLGGITEDKIAWLTEKGIDCEVLKFGATDWQKGRVRIHIEFCPDESGATPSPKQAKASPKKIEEVSDKPDVDLALTSETERDLAFEPEIAESEEDFGFDVEAEETTTEEDFGFESEAEEATTDEDFGFDAEVSETSSDEDFSFEVVAAENTADEDFGFGAEESDVDLDFGAEESDDDLGFGSEVAKEDLAMEEAFGESDDDFSFDLDDGGGLDDELKDLESGSDDLDFGDFGSGDSEDTSDDLWDELTN